MRGTFRGGATRVIAVGVAQRPRRRSLSSRESKIRARAIRSCYVGLVLGVLIGLVFLVISFLDE
jgi:hypothetical protein